MSYIYALVSFFMAMGFLASIENDPLLLLNYIESHGMFL